MTEFFENQSISLEDLPQINTADFTPIEKSYKVFLLIRNSLLITLVFTATLLLHLFGQTELPDWNFAGAYIFFFVLWIMSFVLVELGFKRKAYLLRQHDLLYKTGYIMQKMTAVTKNRIQHVEIRQSILLRIFKLSKLVIFTAGGDKSDLSIPGIKPSDAEKLKEHLSLSISEHV
jgi:membrane protein YdbS with pleckstrin-like domain